MLCGELPKAERERLKKRDSRSQYSQGSFASEAWRQLAIDDERHFFPEAPTRQPFQALFQNVPDQGRRLIRELTNHAVTAWRELHQVSHDSPGTPIPLTLSFPWGTSTYWGDREMYLWALGGRGPHPVSSGLMALEEWALEEVKRGTPVDEVIKSVLDGHEDVAALGVAIAVALEHQHISEVTIPFMSSQRLWGWDIARYSKGAGAAMIGFLGREDAHSRSVRRRGERNGRRIELRSLSFLSVVQGGPLGEQVGEAVSRFTQDLPFDYEEERKNEALAAGLARTAEIWAEFGKRSNYTTRQVENGVVIELQNPKAQGPDIDAINRRQEEIAAHYPLVNWVNACYERGGVADKLTLTEAIERARSLDADDLFDRATKTGDSLRDRQGAVAGVASVALRFAASLSEQDLRWAEHVCERACRTPTDGESYPRSSHLLQDAALFGLRGELGLLRRAPDCRNVLRRVLDQVNHYYEQISLEALYGLIALWDLRPEIGWLGLQLVAEASLVPRAQFDSERHDWHDFGEETLRTAVKRAVTSIPSFDESPRPLRAIPSPWQKRQADSKPRRLKTTEKVSDQWEPGNEELRTGRLGSLLSAIPVEVALADPVRGEYLLSWATELAAWTAEQIAPEWSGEVNQHERRAQSHELSDWGRHLYRFLARISLHLAPTESMRRFVGPLKKTDDEQFASLIDAYVSRLACNIMDEPKFPVVPLELLLALLSRILEHEEWESAQWNDSQIHDNALTQIVRALFFVSIDNVPLAARFSNGNWSEIESILPIVDRVIAAHGPNPTVAETFLALCERAFDHYPIERFIVHLPSVLGADGVPIGWRGTLMPARLAALIQRFADRMQPMPQETARALLRALDALVDMGDRRAAAIQTGEAFKDVRSA